MIKKCVGRLSRILIASHLFLLGCSSNNLVSLNACDSKSSQEVLPWKNRTLFVINKGKRKGYISVDGKIVIEPQFDSAGPMIDGHAAFGNAGKWGIINSKGDIVVSPSFDRVQLLGEERASFFIDGRWGLMDLTGEVILKPTFRSISLFREGVASARANYSIPRKKYKFIDKNGDFISEEAFEGTELFSEGMASFMQSSSGVEYGFLSRDGQIEIKLDAIRSANFGPGLWGGSYFHEGLARMYTSRPKYPVGFFTSEPLMSGSWGYINHQGDVVIPFQYQYASNFHRCAASVKKRGKFGLINPSGEWILKPKYDQIEFGTEGVFVVSHKGEYGYIDASGELITEIKFSEALEFSSGLASVKSSGNGKWGYVDRKGELSIEYKFDKADSFIGDLARVEVNGKWGYVNKTGRIVWLSND